jgi:hypothetical protein
MAYPIPTERERVALFRFLKQHSSYSAWAMMEPHFKAWIDEATRIKPLAVCTQLYEDKPREALYDSDLRLMLTCFAAFVEALAKLKRGDRAVFKWLGYGAGLGYFCEALRAMSVWETASERERRGEYLPLAETDYWTSFKAYFETFRSATGNGSFALEARHTDVPAPLYDITPLNGTSAYTVRPFTPHPVFAALMARDLPPVPCPPEEVIIKTGDNIPFYGIWEPVKLNLSSGFAGLFKKPVLPADGKFEIEGCMNYLHAGSPAPTIAFEGDSPRKQGRPTIWRLLWRDERYSDGVVPDEEKDYVFHVEDYVAALQKEDRSPVPALELLMAASGEVALKSGRWTVKDDLTGHIQMQAGQVLPQHHGREVQWVWSPQ